MGKTVKWWRNHWIFDWKMDLIELNYSGSESGGLGSNVFMTSWITANEPKQMKFKAGRTSTGRFN